MVKIRLARFGTRNRPYYHIVVADSESPRDGRFLEKVGLYDPHKPFSEAKLDMQRVEYWRTVGAKISDTVGKIIREIEKTAAPAGDLTVATLRSSASLRSTSDSKGE